MGVAADAGEARPRASRSGGDRRPGGLSQGGARASTTWPRRRPPWSAGRRPSASRSWSPSSIRRASGTTVPEVAEHLPEGVEPIEKVCFSAAEAEGFDLGGRDQALVCGIEAHVCVNQTVARPARPGGRGARRPSTRWARASTRTVRSGIGEGEARGSRDHQRRDGAVRARRPGRDRRVQGGAESGPRVRPESRMTRAPRKLRLRAARGRRALRRRACTATANADHRRGRLQHLDDRLPGGGHRPLLRGPDHHLHLSADRQLRRRGARRWSPTASRPAG